MNEEAEREASAYVQTAMSFTGYPRRLTVVGSAAKPRIEELMFPVAARVPIVSEEPVRARPLPAIPIGLPEGATLPPMADSIAMVTPLPAPAPVVATAPLALSVTPNPPLEAASSGRMRRRPARDTYAPIMFMLFALVFGALLAGRRRRRGFSRS
jgi:hypothetical protein